MNEKEIKALIKEAEAAAKRYKAQLNAKSKTSTPKTTKASAKSKTNKPRGGSTRGGTVGGLGGGGAMNWETK